MDREERWVRSLRRGEQSCEDSGPLWQRANDNVFPRAVSAISHGTQAVEGGNSKSRGEVSVRAAASRSFSEADAHLTSQFLCAKKQAMRLGRAFHRRTIDAAAHFNARSRQYGPQRVKFAVEDSGISGARKAHIDQRARVFGDNITCRSAGDDVRLHGNSALRVVQLEKTRDLQRQFVHRVDTSFGVNSRVRAAAGNDQFDFTDAFAF